MLYSNREAISLARNETDPLSGYIFAILAQTPKVYLLHLLASLTYRRKYDVTISK